MKVVTTEELINIDKKTTEKIPSILLMEHVALDIFNLLEERYAETLNTHFVHIFSSVGGNGGDGFAVARYLIKNGYNVNVYITGNLDKVNKDTYANFNILKSMNVEIKHLGSEENVYEAIDLIDENDIVLDSLFGTGGRRPLGGIQKLLVDSLNDLNIIRIAIDIPSGLYSKIDDSSNSCFKADETYTVCFAKDIMFLYNTREYIGDLFIIKSIFPENILNEAPYIANLIDYDENIEIVRNAFYSKREQGRLAIVCGSYEYTGACILSAKAAYRSGVGYIRLYVPKAILETVRNAVMIDMPEIVVIGVGEYDNKYFTADDLYIAEDINKSDACIIGSGIGRDMSTEVFINSILKQINIPTVIDADALYMMLPTTLYELGDNFILTPHIYEFEKFMNIDSIEVLENPYTSLLRFREYTKANIILKDAISFIMNNNDIYVNYNPTNGMGKAGMGDVLAGIITSFLGQGYQAIQAALLGVFIHGYTGEQLAKKAYTVLPSRLIEHLPEVMDEMIKSNPKVTLEKSV